jgi:hypothetical protein
MIRDIVVNLNVGAKASPAGDFAISVAAAFNAHLTGIAFLYDPVVPVSSVAPVEVIVTQQDYQAAVRATRERFAAASESAGVTAEPLMLSASVVGVGDQFGKIARRFDLAVVDQAESGTNGVQGVIVEAALFDAGRPVICVPFIQKEPLKLDRVMVCWDGSRAAARAIGDAMPLLQRAGRVEVGYRHQRARQSGSD